MKLIILTSRLPYPIERGDKLRIYHQIRHLSERHEIYLFALTDQEVAAADVAEMQRWCKEVQVHRIRKIGAIWQMLLALFRGWPLQVAYFFRPRLRKQLQQLIQRVQPDHLYCQLLRMAPYVKALDLPATLDYMDCFSVGMKRMQASSPWFWKPIWAWEARQLLRMEGQMYEAFSHHTIISAQDRDHLGTPAGAPVEVVPNGIDLAFFHLPSPPPTPEYDLFFIGNLGYYLNVQAAQYLVQQVMPLVWEKRPDTRLLLAGARPSAEVKALVQDTRVELQAWVPDIRDAYASGKMLVAPLFHSIGQQNKILESMAMEKVCVSTPLVNRAIGATHNETIWMAEDPAGFARQILELLDREAELPQLGAKSRTFVGERFTWEYSVELLEKLWREEG
ncbi:MAG: glycosyltransferase [Bacteroidota bacterium]